ncbi:MAG: YceI family protein [Pseudohongiellaceae bacterium]
MKYPILTSALRAAMSSAMSLTVSLAIALALLTLLTVAQTTIQPALAQSTPWTLDNDTSELSFVTIKAEHIAEVHTFSAMSGTLDESGELTLTIELASVDTLIPIRDERMREMLFETNIFPEATVNAQVDMSNLQNMSPGTTQLADFDFTLTLRGESNSYNAQVMLLRTRNGVVATTLKPVVVTAGSFGLTAGIERLREVAGLPSISAAVPFTFTVSFAQ